MVKDPLIGKTLANFRIDSRLGQGGMAVVYLGMDIQLDRPVAVKLINAQFQYKPEYAERFVAEAKLVARWRHENIIQVFYADQQDDLYYFVMEYIDGATLEDLLKRYMETQELMSHEDVIRIGRDVASGLDYAHKQGVVHRDVKPANIMISQNDRVVVTDFGLALDMGQGSVGEIFGTPHYVAPEQVQHSASASPQSDIYSLGIVLYEMLTGALPFDADSPMAIAIKHLSESPPLATTINPDLNHETEIVLLKALEKEPENRFETALDFINALETALNQIIEDDAIDDSGIMHPAAITKQNYPHARVSMMSISDMLALELRERDAPIPSAIVSPDTQPPSKPSTRKTARHVPTSPSNKVSVSPPRNTETELEKKSNMPLFAGIGIVGVIAIIALVVFMSMGSPDTEQSDTVVAINLTNDVIATSNAEAAATATVIEMTNEAISTDNTDMSLTDEASVTSTVDMSLTNEAVEASNANIALTNEAVVASNANIALTNEAVTANANEAIALETSNAQLEATLTQQANQANTISFSPTELYPSGRLLELTYNSAGFYLRNSSDSRVRDSRLAFQAIDANGSGVSQVFDGVDWARFYNFIDGSGRCVIIELTDQSSWTRPTNCISASGSQYNSQLSFPETDGRIFWTGANGAVQFIVFWDNSEVARCPIANGYCQVRVGG